MEKNNEALCLLIRKDLQGIPITREETEVAEQLVHHILWKKKKKREIRIYIRICLYFTKKLWNNIWETENRILEEREGGRN